MRIRGIRDSEAGRQENLANPGIVSTPGQGVPNAQTVLHFESSEPHLARRSSEDPAGPGEGIGYVKRFTHSSPHRLIGLPRTIRGFPQRCQLPRESINVAAGLLRIEPYLREAQVSGTTPCLRRP